MGDLNAADLRYALDPALFAQDKLALTPDAIQAKVLGHTVHRGLLNCTRQWGKSTIAAVKAVHRAHYEPGSLTVALSPSARQSGEFLRKQRLWRDGWECGRGGTAITKSQYYIRR